MSEDLHLITIADVTDQEKVIEHIKEIDSSLSWTIYSNAEDPGISIFHLKVPEDYDKKGKLAGLGFAKKNKSLNYNYIICRKKPGDSKKIIDLPGDRILCTRHR